MRRKRHNLDKVMFITGRAMALHGISYLPPNLERVEIVAMDGQLQQQ